jgi:O-antigen/teichoic acid export membrane protein
MSRTRRLLSGAVTYYASQVIMLVVSLWITPIILHRVGEVDFGLWLVGLQLLSYLALTDLGIMATVPRATATATGREDPAAVAGAIQVLLGQTWQLVLWQLPFVALLALLIVLNLPQDWAALQVPVGLVMLGYVLMFPFRLFQATLMGLQDLTWLGIVQTVSWAVNTGLNIGLVLAGYGLWGLAWGWLASQVTLQLCCACRLLSRYPDYFPWRLAPLGWRAAKQRLGEGIWISLSQVAVALINATDCFLIGYFLGPAAVVPYACTTKLIQVFGNHAQAILQMSLPALTEISTSQRPERIREVCLLLTRTQLLFTGAVCCVVLAVNAGFVAWWIGTPFYAGPLVTTLVVLVPLLRHWNSTAVFSLFSFGKERRTTITTALDGLVTVISATVCIRLFGVAGAPAGSLIGVALVSLPSNLAGLAGLLGVSFREMVAPFAPWFWRFALLAAGLGVLGHSYAFDRFYLLAGVASGVAALYLLVMYPVLAHPALNERLQPIWLGIRNRLLRRVA